MANEQEPDKALEGRGIEFVPTEWTPPAPAKQRRGFALLTPEQRRQIASAGGKAAHEQGTGHEFTPDEAAAAGRKGGAGKHKK